MRTNLPTTEPGSIAPFAARLNGLSKLLFWPFLIFTLALCGLEFGVWETTETHWGPFAQDPFVPPSLSGRSVGFAIGSEHAFKCCISLRSDINEHPIQSDLRLWINDHEMHPAHAPHDLIRRGETGGFSNWAGYVIFSLPPGVHNDSEVKATIRYPFRPLSGSTPASVLVACLLGVIAYGRSALRVPLILLLTLGYSALLLSALYLISTLVALADGWALPTTALIRWSSAAEWLALNEPFLGHVLLVCAGFGVAAAWLRSFLRLEAAEEAQEGAAFRCFFRRWGLLITACALTFSISGMWAGLVRPGDLDSSAIGGMIPVSDASAYLAAAYDQAKEGVWPPFALRRPLAAAFRSTLLFFAASSLPVMLLLQACLLAGAMCFATAAVTRWRGLWAGLTFFALTYLYIRTFVPTTLTEPLGLLMALVSIPFFIEAFRTESVPAALLAFVFTTIALMTRTGSMFTIPALMFWLLWHFGTTLRERTRVGLLAIAIITGISTVNYLLEKAYGNPQYLAASNFSYTLCGLTMGTTWEGCLPKLAERTDQLPHTEGETAKILYSLAWDNFTNHPSALFNRVIAGAHAFWTDILDLLFRGYGTVVEPRFFPRTLIVALIFIGLIYVLARENRKQLAFWALLWASIVSSAAMVFFDDGRRALASSYPLIFLFFAMGMTGPTVAFKGESGGHPKLLRFGMALVIAVLFLFFSIPWLAHRLFLAQTLMPGEVGRKPDEAVVFAGRRLAGFLILPDEMPLRKETASLHLSQFEAIVKQSGVEKYQGLIHPEMPPLPFGFIFAPRLEKGAGSDYKFIVPPDVMERWDVQVWRLQVKTWQPESSRMLQERGYEDFWLYVTHAEPLH